MISTEAKSVKELYLDVTGMELLPVKILGDYREYGASGVIDMGTFSTEETEKLIAAGIALVNSKGDGWKHPELLSGSQKKAPGCCSSCIKRLEDGTVLMGRNMDLPSSFSPAIIFRTRGNGRDTYDTVNLEYTAPGLITFDQIAELGTVPRVIFEELSAGACDVFNSADLFMQYDMRESEDCPTSSTNPESKLRVSSFNVIRLLGQHCATISEALEYLKTLDIYDCHCAAFDWSMAIGIMDRTGRYGVIEFANNKIIWNEGRPGFACGHCNFYWTKEPGTRRFGTGFGRWQKLMEYYYDIETEEDMRAAMERIRYSQLYTDGRLARDWKLNLLSEMCDKIPNFITEKFLSDIYAWRDAYGIEIDEKHLEKVLEIEKRQNEQGDCWSVDYLNQPENYYDVLTAVDLYIKCFAKLPPIAQKMSGMMECSTLSYVANNQRLEWTNRFFEMNDVYHIGLHETVIERIPATKKLGNF